jgi:hypothetical protein
VAEAPLVWAAILLWMLSVVCRGVIECLVGVLEWLLGVCDFNVLSIYYGGSDVVIGSI